MAQLAQRRSKDSQVLQVLLELSYFSHLSHSLRDSKSRNASSGSLTSLRHNCQILHSSQSITFVSFYFLSAKYGIRTHMPEAMDFKSTAYSVPPIPHKEPDVGFEPTTSRLQGGPSTVEIIRQYTSPRRHVHGMFNDRHCEAFGRGTRGWTRTSDTRLYPSLTFKSIWLKYL